MVNKKDINALIQSIKDDDRLQEESKSRILSMIKYYTGVGEHLIIEM